MNDINVCDVTMIVKVDVS